MTKETNPVDDFFRKSLQDLKVTPSEAARNRFLDEVVTPGGKRISGRFRWYYVPVVAVLVSVAVYLSFHSSNVTKEFMAPAASREAGISNSATTQPGKEGVPSPVIKTKKNSPTSIHSVSEAVSVTNPTAADSKVSRETMQAAVSAAVPDRKNPELRQTVRPEIVIADVNLPGPKSSSEKEVAATLASAWKMQQSASSSEIQKSETPPVFNAAEKPVTPVNNTPEEPIKTDSQKPLPAIPVDPTPQFNTKNRFQRWEFNPSLQYSLDWNINGNADRFAHLLAVDVTIKRGRFSMTSGAGLSIINGYHRYEVKYNEYLGEYHKLDSITFAWDRSHYKLVPLYYTTETKVWDSLLSPDSYQVEKRYQLIRVPLLLGYEFLQKGKFSLGIHAGIEASFYLASHFLNGEYNAGQNKVLSVNPLTDGFRKTNVYGLANLSFACNLNKRLTLEFEPRIHYLLNATTELRSSSTLLLPSVRASLKIKF